MSAAGLKVLLVEDVLSVAELLEFSLRRACGDQFVITHVCNWSEAVEQLRRRRFDVLLLDLSLPEGQGVETFVRARADAPQLPIVGLTGNEDEAVAAEAARQGVEEYLVKGVGEGRQIARSIRYAIERWQANKHRDGLAGLLKLFAAGAPRGDYLEIGRAHV